MTEQRLNNGLGNNNGVMASQQHWDDFKMQDEMIPELRYPVAAPGVFSTTEANKQQPIHPTPEYVFQSRVPGVAHSDKERQRTIQACDKCRERKTKCSGDRPVCARCTARGLICNYSNREPRTRGPSKARLRNAISSTDLRTTTKSPLVSQQSWPSQIPNGISRHYRNLSANYDTGIQRAPSLPSSRYDQFRSGIQPGQLFNDYSFDPLQDNYSPVGSLFNNVDFNAAQFPTTLFQSQLPFPYNNQIPQPVSSPRDVRRVQSHSALQGKPVRPPIQPAIDPALTKSSPLLSPPKTAYNQLFYGQQDPDHLSPMFQMQQLPRSAHGSHSPYIEHLSQVNPDIQLNWGYQSDGSTGSDGLDHPQVSSPSTSSEGMSETISGGASSMGAPSPEPFDFMPVTNGNITAPIYTGIEASQNMPGDMFATMPNQSDPTSFPACPNSQQMYGGFASPDDALNSMRAVIPQFDSKGQQIFHN